MDIINLWFLMHEPEAPGGPLECVIAGPPDAGYEQFGMAICDLIRHVARAKDVDEADVFAWVQREMDNPTSALTRIGPN